MLDDLEGVDSSAKVTAPVLTQTTPVIRQTGSSCWVELAWANSS